ncbi:isopenicillin N synthase family dioxygenase [Halomonas sp.]|uniref:isopenicillin N synthase family dioxygenase n=1 Tax=Halomonas sp. TaxID=1486246 RepID=UPI003F935039
MNEVNPDQRLADFQEIPVIDIYPLLHGDEQARRRVADELGRAARDIGFFQMVGHGIDHSLREGLITQTKRLFAQPEAAKMERYIGRYFHHRGYVPPGEESPDPKNPDMKEAFDLAFELPSDDPEVLAGTPLLGPNPWPDLDGFREPVAAYYDATYQVGRALMGGFALALGLEEQQLLCYVTKPPSQLRLIHYPYNPDAKNAKDTQGIGAHTDYECFTLLLPTAPGLEVMNGAGKWIDVPYQEDALVVNIGDMLEIWSNGEFVATSHRVRKVKEERYSFPLFFACDYHTVVEPLPELVARHGKARYEALKAGDHLYAQTIQTFRYLRERLARGEITLPESAREVGSLGQHGKHKEDSL